MDVCCGLMAADFARVGAMAAKVTKVGGSQSRRSGTVDGQARNCGRSSSQRLQPDPNRHAETNGSAGSAHRTH
eukprot:2027153-Prymnesium_polylepis.1